MLGRIISSVAGHIAFYTAIAHAATPSSGCGSPIPKEVSIGGPSYNFTNFASNSSAANPLRAYSLTLPVDYDPSRPAPLILSFHGRGGNNQAQEDQSKFSDPYFNKKAIAVYPMGIARQWQGDPDNPSTINDTLFISELITHLESRFCVAADQIYAAGKSNGGSLVGQLACNPATSSRIAAFAAAPLAWYFDKATSTCSPSRTTVPILELHGGADTRIVYEGGPDKYRPGLTTEAIPTWLQQWAVRDQCNPTNSTVPLVGVVGDNEVSVTTWDCGSKKGLVSHYLSKNMTHVWPTAANAGYNGTQVILDFFRKWGMSA